MPGESSQEVLFSTYCCHPSMANNELSGPAVVAWLARLMRERIPAPRLTYRFLFAPETIGTIAYLSRGGTSCCERLIAGYVVDLRGHAVSVQLQALAPRRTPWPTGRPSTSSATRPCLGRESTSIRAAATSASTAPPALTCRRVADPRRVGHLDRVPHLAGRSRARDAPGPRRVAGGLRAHHRGARGQRAVGGHRALRGAPTRAAGPISKARWRLASGAPPRQLEAQMFLLNFCDGASDLMPRPSAGGRPVLGAPRGRRAPDRARSAPPCRPDYERRLRSAGSKFGSGRWLSV